VTQIESGSKLKEINNSAFYECAIQSIEIPSNIEMIGDWCFSDCKSLCEITFESISKLKEIGKNAFSNRLECVKVPAGFTVEYHWPDDCRIEYYDQKVATQFALRKGRNRIFPIVTQSLCCQSGERIAS
jgi:hypothetical protein